MQDSLAIPQWILESLKWLAGISAGSLIYRFVTLYQNRRRPHAEIHRTEAEATEITIRSSSTAGDAVMRMMDRLDEAQRNIDRLRTERDQWQDEYDKVFVERDDLIKRNGLLIREVNGYTIQIERMHSTLKQHGLNYDNTQGVKVGDGESQL